MTTPLRLFTLTAALAVFSSVPATAQEPAKSDPLVNAELIGDELPGSFFIRPEGEGPFPAIILLGGSEGNDSAARSKAPLFLAEGYAVLGLPYYSPAWAGAAQKFPALPRAFAEIPVDSAEVAKNWLAARNDVRAEDIAIYGVSKGAEFALLAGSKIDGFAAIAAIVPTDVVWEGWGTMDGSRPSSFSWRGEPLPFVRYEGMEEEFASPTGANGRPRLRLPHDKGRNANPQQAVAARIEIARIDEPLLVAGSDGDQTWNSGEMTQTIAEKRAELGLPTVSLVFTDAGHQLSGTGKPNPRRSEADLTAQRKIWPATLEFFAAHLKD